MLHTCVQCDGEKYIDYYKSGWSLIPNDIRKCESCNGEGELESCQCHAFCSCECICGAWNDSDCNCND